MRFRRREDPPQEAPVSSESKRILVVDDEWDIRNTLRTILTKAGYRIELAATGTIALAKLRAMRFDLMVLDLMMPVMDGYAVLKEIPPSARDRMPVIILTAKTGDQDMMDCYDGGASYYLTKPYRAQRLLDIIQYLIEDLDSTHRGVIELKL